MLDLVGQYGIDETITFVTVERPFVSSSTFHSPRSLIEPWPVSLIARS